MDIGSSSSKYEGMIDCFKKIYKEEGFAGFYEGFLVDLIGTAFVNGVVSGITTSLKYLRDSYRWWMARLNRDGCYVYLRETERVSKDR